MSENWNNVFVAVQDDLWREMVAAKDVEITRLQESIAALLKERDDLKESFWRELDRRSAALGSSEPAARE